MQTSRPDLNCLPSRPMGAVPIPAAFMLSEHEVLPRTPMPVIRMNHDMSSGRILVGFGTVPADMPAADDRCRRTHYQAPENTGACSRANKALGKGSHLCTPMGRFQIEL